MKDKQELALTVVEDTTQEGMLHAKAFKDLDLKEVERIRIGDKEIQVGQ